MILLHHPHIFSRFMD